MICCCISYRIQSFALQSKINGWFLYEMQQQAELGYAKIPLCNVSKNTEFCSVQIKDIFHFPH